MDIDRIAKGLYEAMKAKDLTLETLRDKAPAGFWAHAAPFVDMKSHTIQVNWNRKKEALSAAIRHLEDAEERERKSVNVDTDEVAFTVNVDKADISEPTSAVMVNVDTPEPTPSTSLTNVNVDTLAGEDIGKMLQAMESRLTELIVQKLTHGVSGNVNVDRGRNIDKVDKPPLPEKSGSAGKKFQGTKADLRVRVDRNLFTLFENEARDDFSGNLSRCLDTILWRYYGKPPLSFEKRGDEPD